MSAELHNSRHAQRATHQLRLNRFIGLAPERIRSAVAWFEQSQLPVLSSIGGFRTVFLGHEMASGTAAGMTFWESESSLQVTESREAASRELDSDDRSWLNERLEEYRELFTYLHDH